MAGSSSPLSLRFAVEWTAGNGCVDAAGYLLWVSTHCTLSPLLWRPGSVEYWIALTNVLGSVGFLVAGAVTQPAVHGSLALTFVQVCERSLPFCCVRGRLDEIHHRPLFPLAAPGDCQAGRTLKRQSKGLKKRNGFLRETITSLWKPSPVAVPLLSAQTWNPPATGVLVQPRSRIISSPIRCEPLPEVPHTAAVLDTDGAGALRGLLRGQCAVLRSELPHDCGDCAL